MLRSTPIACNWQARRQLERVRPMLMGRAGKERKLGHMLFTQRLRAETTHRVTSLSKTNGSHVRLNVDSALQEHGTDWSKARNDFARQNVALFPRSMQQLAQYEPMSFRALVELSASNIAPPPAPHDASKVAPAPYDPKLNALLELRGDVDRMLRHKSKLQGQADDWMDSWKQFAVEEAGQPAATMKKATQKGKKKAE
jgi:hypothetical protein